MWELVYKLFASSPKIQDTRKFKGIISFAARPHAHPQTPMAPPPLRRPPPMYRRPTTIISCPTTSAIEWLAAGGRVATKAAGMAVDLRGF